MTGGIRIGRCTRSALLSLGFLIPCLCLAQTDSLAEQYASDGQRALAAGQYTAAQASFEKLAKLEPNVGEVHATLAVIYFQQRQYDQAVREIHVAQKLSPSLPRLDSLLGLSLAEIGKYTESLPGLEKGFEQTSDLEVRRMCGLHLLRVYSALHRDSDAIEVALILNRVYPNDPEVLYHTGRVYGNQAYVVMEKLHDKAPDSIWMLQAHGEANESQKEYESAIVSFNHVLALEPHRPGIHYRIGRVYLKRFRDSRNPEDRSAAKNEFSAELEIDPANGNARYELAQMAVDDNHLDEAGKLFGEVVERFPEFEEALVGLGEVYLETRSTAAAIATLERATRLDANDEVAWYRLARAERAGGHSDAANKALETYHSLHSSTPAISNPARIDEVTAQEIGPDAPP